MPVEVGELEVVTPPAQNGAARDGGAPQAAAPGGAPSPFELERVLALEHTRDLRLQAD